MTLIFTTVFGIAILPLFPLAGSGSSSFRLSELLEMVLGIVPDNFFTPFLEGNPLQIIFLAVLAGMAMLILGNRAAIVSLFLEQANAIILLIMENISAFVPVFIFGSLFNMILGKNFSVLLKAYKVPLVMLLGDVFLMAVYTGLVCILVLCQEKVQVKSELFLQHSIPLILPILPSFLISAHTHSRIRLVIDIHNDYGFLPYYKMSLCIQILIYKHDHNFLF